MIFNVSGLLQDSSGSERRHRLECEELESQDFGTLRQVTGPVSLMRTDRTVLVTANLEALADIECSRCLKPAVLRLSAFIVEEFQPVNSDLGGAQRQSPFDEGPTDPHLWIDDRNELDIREVVRQSFAAAAPIAPVCSDDCLGLCPVCWNDRNEIHCECDQSEGDSRWEGLASLRSHQANSPD